MYKECITMKRLLLLILCAVMTFSAFNLALSEGQPCEDGFYYEVLADGNARITGYDYSVLPTTATLLDVRGFTLNPAYDVVIPSEIGGHTVTEAVIEPALWAYTFIPETVTRLEVRMPAEKDLSAQLVRIDPEYARIGLRRLTDTVCWRTTDGRIDTGIDPYERIGVEIDENNPVYTAEDGLVYDKTGNTLVFAANRSHTSYTQWGDSFSPIQVKNGTKRIGDFAFSNCISDTVIVLPDSVTEYGSDCFPDGVCATKLPVSMMNNDSMYFYFNEQHALTLAGWNQERHTSTLSKRLSAVSIDNIWIPVYNQYFYNIPGDVSGLPVTAAVLDPNTFNGLYVPSSVTGLEFRESVSEDRYVLCLVGVDVQYYPVRKADEPQMVFIEDGHPAFSMRNGMLYDKAGETLIFCPRRGTSVTIPEGTKKVLKNAFLSWPGGTVIAAEEGVEWEEQRLRDGSAPVIVPLSGYSPAMAADTPWYPDTMPEWLYQPGVLFPAKSGTDFYKFYYSAPESRKILSVSGAKTADDTTFTVSSTGNGSETLLQKTSSAYLLPLAISEERFMDFTDRMGKKNRAVTKKSYDKKIPSKLSESELRALSEIYPDLAEGKTVYVLKEYMSQNNKELLAGYFAEAGYTEEDYALDMARIILPDEFDYSLSCTAVREYDGRDLICSFTGLSLTSCSSEKCEYITLNPQTGAGIPAASGFVYMPQMLVENAQYHASDAEDRWDWWYADLDAGVNELPVYSQQVPDGTYVCTVTSDMPLRIRVPADMTYLSTAAGEYARVQVRTDENGNAAGHVTVEYRFVPNEP